MSILWPRLFDPNPVLGIHSNTVDLHSTSRHHGLGCSLPCRHISRRDMSDAESFEPLIRNILTGPGVDLSTVSAKRVRKQLLALAPSLTEESLKAIKDDVDAVITRVYSEVKEQADESEHVDEDQEEEEEEAEQPPKKKAKKDRPSSDEVYAQKLAQELNGHSTRKSKSSSSTPRKGTSKSAKSAATIDSDDEAEGSKPTKKRKRVKKEKEPGDPSAPAKGGFAKEYNLRCFLRSLT